MLHPAPGQPGTNTWGDGVDAALAAAPATYARVANRKVNLLDVVTPSGTDDTTAVNAALATFAAAGGGTLQIPRANWKFTGATGLALTGTSNPINIVADPGAVFDMTGSSASIGLLLGGSLTSTSAALGADVAAFADTITCALTVVPGDILRITSTVWWELWAATPKGEMVEVLSSAAGVITLKSGLYDSYTAATTTVTKMQMPVVSVKGLTITHNANVQGLQVAYARNVVLSGLTGSGARERLHYLNHVFGGTVENCQGTDFWYTGSGTSYGLCVANCQDITERNNTYRGGCHAVAHGGETFVTRNIKIVGGTYDNYHAQSQPSFNFHAGVEGVSMIGVTMLNGIRTNASNLDAEGCTIRAVNQHGVTAYTPRSCAYVRFRNADIQTAAGYEGWMWLPSGAVATTHTTDLVEISGVIRAGAAAISILPTASGDANSVITRLVVSGDIRSGGSSQAVNTGVTGAASVLINTAEFSGYFRAPATHGMVLAGSTAGVLRIHDCKVSQGGTATKAVAITSFTDVHLDNVILEGTAAPYKNDFVNPGILSLKNVLIDGSSSTGGLYTSTQTEAIISNLRRINTTGTPTLPARTYEAMTAGGLVRSTGSAAPAAGTWKVGDYVRNSVPAVGSAKGWLCTVAGTPGTWVSEGNL